MTKKSLVVTFSTIFFAVSLGNLSVKGVRKKLGKIVKLVFKTRFTQNVSML